MQAFADGGVRLAVAPVAGLGRLALHEPRRRTVTVAAEATRMAPGTLATLVAHEGPHVYDFVSGVQLDAAPTLADLRARRDDIVRIAAAQGDVLEGGEVVPGWAVPVRDCFL